MNGPPHLGHASCTVAVDAVARHHRGRGRSVFFQTGTDEHGLNVERTAAREGLHPRALADRNAERYRAAWDALDVRPDRFLRTTEAAHHRAAQALWRRLERAGALRRGTYEGSYCAPCEAFLAEAELGPGGRCPVHGVPCERQRETNTFLCLSRQAAALRALVAESGFVEPRSYRGEVLGWFDRGLPDLSLTRQSVRWGIPAPGLPGEVLYVFGADALTNYLTGQGFPDPEGAWPTLFPRTVHVIGKEILRFHALSWPGLLRAAGLPLPRGLRVHGHFTVEGEKISKTRGNAVDPLALAEEVGADALRFFLLRSKPFDRDGDFSRGRAVRQWNAELAGGLGNWAQRVAALGDRAGRIGAAVPAVRAADDFRLLAAAAGAERAAAEAYEEFAFHRALGEAASLVAEASRHLEAVAPWALLRSGGAADRRRCAEALEAHRRALAVAARIVAPVTPRAAAVLAARLESGLPPGPPIFPRLE